MFSQLTSDDNLRNTIRIPEDGQDAFTLFSNEDFSVGAEKKSDNKIGDDINKNSQFNCYKRQNDLEPLLIKQETLDLNFDNIMDSNLMLTKFCDEINFTNHYELEEKQKRSLAKTNIPEHTKNLIQNSNCMQLYNTKTKNDATIFLLPKAKICNENNDYDINNFIKKEIINDEFQTDIHLQNNANKEDKNDDKKDTDNNKEQTNDHAIKKHTDVIKNESNQIKKNSKVKISEEEIKNVLNDKGKEIVDKSEKYNSSKKHYNSELSNFSIEKINQSRNKNSDEMNNYSQLEFYKLQSDLEPVHIKQEVVDINFNNIAESNLIFIKSSDEINFTNSNLFENNKSHYDQEEKQKRSLAIRNKRKYTKNLIQNGNYEQLYNKKIKNDLTTVLPPRGQTCNENKDCVTNNFVKKENTINKIHSNKYLKSNVNKEDKNSNKLEKNDIYEKENIKKETNGHAVKENNTRKDRNNKNENSKVKMNEEGVIKTENDKVMIEKNEKYNQLKKNASDLNKNKLILKVVKNELPEINKVNYKQELLYAVTKTENSSKKRKSIKLNRNFEDIKLEIINKCENDFLHSSNSQNICPDLKFCTNKDCDKKVNENLAEELAQLSKQDSYKYVSRRWNSKFIPNPNQNLTTHLYGKKISEINFKSICNKHNDDNIFNRNINNKKNINHGRKQSTDNIKQFFRKQKKELRQLLSNYNDSLAKEYREEEYKIDLLEHRELRSLEEFKYFQEYLINYQENDLLNNSLLSLLEEEYQDACNNIYFYYKNKREIIVETCRRKWTYRMKNICQKKKRLDQSEKEVIKVDEFYSSRKSNLSLFEYDELNSVEELYKQFLDYYLVL